MKSTSQIYPRRDPRAPSRHPGGQQRHEELDGKAMHRGRSGSREMTDRHQNERPTLRRMVRWVGETLQDWAESGARGLEQAGNRARDWTEELEEQALDDRGSRHRYGRLPKGFHRDDERIREDVCYELTCADLDASEIEVMVKDAEVTLRGIVQRREWKRMAEDISEDVFGVENVQNQLRYEKQDTAGINGQRDRTTGDYRRGSGDESRPMP